MPFREKERLRLHLEGIRSKQDIEKDLEYHRTAWFAFTCFLFGGLFGFFIMEALRILLHFAWRT